MVLDSMVESKVFSVDCLTSKIFHPLVMFKNHEETMLLVQTLNIILPQFRESDP